MKYVMFDVVLSLCYYETITTILFTKIKLLLIIPSHSYQFNSIIIPCIGGTSIEDVAEATPELIFKQPIDITKGSRDLILRFVNLHKYTIRTNLIDYFSVHNVSIIKF